MTKTHREIYTIIPFKLLLDPLTRIIKMSFGVDALGGLAEKLKQLLNETQEQYESLVAAIQLYKKGKVNEKEFFSKIAEYLVSSSALNFLVARVMLEMKAAIAKGSSVKSPSAGITSYGPSTGGSSFGIGGFVEGSGSRD